MLQWVKKATVLAALKRHIAAAKAVTSSNWGRQAEKFNDIVVWCVDYLDFAPTTNYQVWKSRFPHRKRLDNLDVVGKSADGRKSIIELLILVISEIEALPYETVEVSMLPGIRVTARSESQKAALTLANERRREEAKKRAERQAGRFGDLSA